MLKKAELLALAKELKIRGRSKLTKQQLIAAIKAAGGVVEEGEKKGMKQQKVDEIYKVDTQPAKKVVKKSPSPSPKPKASPPKLPKLPKMSPKMESQLKQKMVEIQAEGKK